MLHDDPLSQRAARLIVHAVAADAAAAGEQQAAGVGRQLPVEGGDLAASEMQAGRVVEGEVFHARKLHAGRFRASGSISALRRRRPGGCWPHERRAH